jgi:hypothetical protein
VSSQAYLFAHRALPVLTFADPGKVLSILSSGDGERFLHDAWENIGRHCEPEQRRSTEGLGYSVSPTGSTGLVAAVRLPPPQEVGEAYYVAIFGRFADPEQPDPAALEWARLFTLEHAEHPVTGLPCTMLCEWTGEGKHNNYGEGPSTEESDFIEAALNLQWEQKERAEEPPPEAQA